ncbi:MAG TPA: DUF92 domain-containing protein [Acidobacteriaceae bacterium]|nr:DUF92 domain-containing protein [Acidobacteriaceae bacterium]
MSRRNQSVTPLRWQSQMLLALVIVPVTAAVAVEGIFFAPGSPWLPVRALGLGAVLPLMVWKSRAATPGAALCGGLYAATLLLVGPGWRTPFWPLFALLMLTLGATRFGRVHKEALGLAEARHGRNAAQVTANLGIAALAAVALRFSLSLATPAILNTRALRLALAAALAEAAADTLSSELGEVLGGEPRMLTTFRRVPAGTDGAISLAGTLAGVTAAVVIAAVAVFALGLTLGQAALVILAAVAGLFVDSLLGALLERRGWLNNDAVNFLSTFVAALLAYWMG